LIRKERTVRKEKKDLGKSLHHRNFSFAFSAAYFASSSAFFFALSKKDVSITPNHNSTITFESLHLQPVQLNLTKTRQKMGGRIEDVIAGAVAFHSAESSEGISPQYAAVERSILWSESGNLIRSVLYISTRVKVRTESKVDSGR